MYIVTLVPNFNTLSFGQKSDKLNANVEQTGGVHFWPV